MKKEQIKQLKTKALKLMIKDSKQEEKEINDLIHPKSIWKKLRLIYTHFGFIQIRITNIRIRHTLKQISMIENCLNRIKNTI